MFRIPRPIKVFILLRNTEGGTGTFLLNLLKIMHLFSKGELLVKVFVVEKPKYISSNPNFYYLNKANFTIFHKIDFNNIASFIKNTLLIKKYIKDFDPDILFGIDVYSNLILQLCKIFTVKPVKTILTTHINLSGTLSVKSTKILHLFLKKIISFLYNKADVLIGISKNVSKDLEKSFLISKKIKTVYYGINLLQNEVSIKRSKTKTILSVLRFDSQKDIPTLIVAFKLLVKEYSSVNLFLLGEGPERKKIEKQIEELQLAKKIRILGWTRNINPWLKKTDIFVLPTKREGFSYALLEAMSFGKPVISSDAPFGPKEVLDNGKYGILVPIGNPLVLKGRLLELIQNKQLYLYYAKKSLERARYFSLEKMLLEYKKIITYLKRGNNHPIKHKNTGNEPGKVYHGIKK